jgi:hypothetical protein
VRSLSGQYGQVSGLFSSSGGCGITSNWVTEAAPWRLEVPTQSEPVSPPPITTTCLPVALIGFFVAGHFLVLRRQELQREMHAASSRPGTGRSRGTSEPPASITASNSDQLLAAEITSTLASLM